MASATYMTEETDIWVTLFSLPGHIENIASNKNHHELIIAAYPKQYEPGIYTYNIHENTWSKIMPYADHLPELTASGFALNEQNKLYTFNYWGQMMIADLNAQTIEVIDGCGVNDKCKPLLVAIDGDIHLIGAQEYDPQTGINAKHFIWSDDRQTFTQLTYFPQFSDICNSAAIYVPRKKVILHIGGYNQKYNVDDEDIDEVVPLNKIYEYCLVSQQWSALEGIQFEGRLMHLALTSDECHVIIAGGAFSDDIYVLEIRYDCNENNEYKFKKSSVKCPNSGPCYIAITGGIMDEILVTGFIRSVFKSFASQHNMQLPPLCVIKMILSWYAMEMLHWFQTEDNEHLAVALQKVV